MIIAIPPRNDENFSAATYWEKFLLDEDIQQIISLPQWKNITTSELADGTTCDFIRKSQTTWFEPNEATNHIWQKIAQAIANCNQNHFKFDLTGCYEPGQLTLYRGSEKEHYSWHVDGGFQKNVAPRKLSMSLLLNDVSDFEGGELLVKNVDDNPITLEQKKGRAWFFPSYTLHTVTPVTRGERKSLVLWIGGPAFR